MNTLGLLKLDRFPKRLNELPDQSEKEWGQLCLEGMGIQHSFVQINQRKRMSTD